MVSTEERKFCAISVLEYKFCECLAEKGKFWAFWENSVNQRRFRPLVKIFVGEKRANVSKFKFANIQWVRTKILLVISYDYH